MLQTSYAFQLRNHLSSEEYVDASDIDRKVLYKKIFFHKLNCCTQINSKLCRFCTSCFIFQCMSLFIMYSSWYKLRTILNFFECRLHLHSEIFIFSETQNILNILFACVTTILDTSRKFEEFYSPNWDIRSSKTGSVSIILLLIFSTVSTPERIFLSIFLLLLVHHKRLSKFNCTDKQKLVTVKLLHIRTRMTVTVKFRVTIERNSLKWYILSDLIFCLRLVNEMILISDCAYHIHENVFCSEPRYSFVCECLTLERHAEDLCRQ